jgi:hypothetical protein
MSRESEFLTRHKEDLVRGSELCRLLQRNMIEKQPRELHYLELMKICKRLEGTARQMAHERGDDFTWLSLGNLYFKTGEMVRKCRRRQDWMRFGDLSNVFQAGVSRIDKIAHAATGRSSLSASGLILPAHMRPAPTGRIIH